MCVVFFFFKQKTAYEMRISDWSSDVCSSDLLVILALMFVAFVRERYSPTVVSVVGACAFALLGLLDEKDLFSVFSNSAPLTVGAMFVLSGALIRTGTINRVADLVMARAQRHPRLALAEVTPGTVVLRSEEHTSELQY